MSSKNKEYLKGRFANGCVPDETDFEDLLDSGVNKQDDVDATIPATVQAGHVPSSGAVKEYVGRVAPTKDELTQLSSQVSGLSTFLDDDVTINKNSSGVTSDLSYFNMRDLVVGSTYTGSTSSANANRYKVKIDVTAGQKVTIYSYCNSATAGYLRPYCLCNTSNEVVKIAPAQNINDYTSGETISIEVDGYLYVNCQKDGYENTFKVVVNNPQGVTSKIKREANALISPITEEVSDLSTDVNGLSNYIHDDDVTINKESSGVTSDLSYFDLHGLDVGSTYTGTTKNSSTNKYKVKIDVTAGQKVTIFSYTIQGASGYARPYCLCNTSNEVVKIAPAETPLDYTSGETITITSDGYLYINCEKTGYENTFKVVVQATNGITSKINTRIESAMSGVTPQLTKINEIENYVKSKITTTDKDSSGVTSDLSYFNMIELEVGSTYNGATRNADANRYKVKIDVTAGQKVTIYSYCNSATAGYLRPYCLCNTSNEVVKIAPAQKLNDYTSGETITIEADGYLYVNCQKDGYENVFKVIVKTQAGIEPSIDTKIAESTSVIRQDVSLISANKDCSCGFVLSNKRVNLAGASICSYAGFFEYAMAALGLTGNNISEAGKNIFNTAYKLYSNGASYQNDDLIILACTHNHDVFTLPSGKDSWTPSDYESDSELSAYVTTNAHITGDGGFGSTNYTDDELYAMGYDYCIKKWAGLCYALKDSSGYDSAFGKPFQVMLYSYWHDARTKYNQSIRKLAKKWGFPLVKEDDNIGFSKDMVHPITGEQVSRLYCSRGIPWSAKTEVIDGVTYGFHPDGIATTDWSTFLAANLATKESMMPYLQLKRARILINMFKDAI